MALVLSIRNKPVIFIDGERLEAVSDQEKGAVIITYKGATYNLTGDDVLELESGVKIFLEMTSKGYPTLAKLIIDAPKSIPILRDGATNTSKIGELF